MNALRILGLCALALLAGASAAAAQVLPQGDAGIPVTGNSPSQELNVISKVDTNTKLMTDTRGLNPPVNLEKIQGANPGLLPAETPPQVQTPVPQTTSAPYEAAGQMPQASAPVEEGPVQQRAQQILNAEPQAAQPLITPEEAMAAAPVNDTPGLAASAPSAMGYMEVPSAAGAYGGSSLFNDYDSNGDGSVSREEFMASKLSAYAPQLFVKLDADKSGRLDSQEFMKEVRYQEKTGGSTLPRRVFSAAGQ